MVMKIDMLYLMCRVNLFEREKPLPQTVQTHGFSPVCVRRWHCKSDERGNARSHRSHLYGFSPVCLRKCTIKFDEFEKLRPQ